MRPCRPYARGILYPPESSSATECDVAVPITPIQPGDVVRLKKPHPCGANEWQITKLGMDIGLLCVGCGRKVRLERYEFDRRFRGFITRASGEEG
jgi:hypothetical protein